MSLLSAAGTQDARATFAAATDWYAVVASPLPRRRSLRRRTPEYDPPFQLPAGFSFPAPMSQNCR